VCVLAHFLAKSNESKQRPIDHLSAGEHEHRLPLAVSSCKHGRILLRLLVNWCGGSILFFSLGGIVNKL
jgi:hypothetical protein